MYFQVIECDYKRLVDWRLGFIAHFDTAHVYTLQFTITHTSFHSHIFITIAW
jgi:hypothetical protein